MMPKPPSKLLWPKAFVKIGQRNVRVMFEMDKCAQVTKEIQRYEMKSTVKMRWNS